MLVRYKYCIGDRVFGWYVCDVVDFRKLWKVIGNSVDWCNIDLWDKRRVYWSCCDCWVYHKDWKKKGWYDKGWKYCIGV